jgi:hypothetical protein
MSLGYHALGNVEGAVDTVSNVLPGAGWRVLILAP